MATQKVRLGAAAGTPEHRAATKDSVFQGGAKFFKVNDPTIGDVYLTQQGEGFKQVAFEDIPEEHRNPFKELAEASQPFFSELSAKKYPGLAKAGGSATGFGFAPLTPGVRDVELLPQFRQQVRYTPEVGSGNIGFLSPQSLQKNVQGLVGQQASDLAPIGQALRSASIPTQNFDLSKIDPNAKVTVQSPKGQTRQVHASTVGGFIKAGWSVTGQPTPAVTPTATTQRFAGGNQTTVSIVDFLDSVGQPSDYNTRAGLAQQAGIPNYRGTAAQNTQLLNSLRTPAPTTVSGISGDTLKPAEDVALPGAVADTPAEADAVVMSGTTSIAEIMKQLTPQETEADVKQQAIYDQMASLAGEQAQKASDQLTAEQSAGLPDLRQDFADINAQILSKAAEYKVLQTTNQNKPITMNSIIGNDRAIMNAQAADIGLLQARALGLQGQIETAQNTVNVV